MTAFETTNVIPQRCSRARPGWQRGSEGSRNIAVVSGSPAKPRRKLLPNKVDPVRRRRRVAFSVAGPRNASKSNRPRS